MRSPQRDRLDAVQIDIEAGPTSTWLSTELKASSRAGDHQRAPYQGKPTTPSSRPTPERAERPRQVRSSLSTGHSVRASACPECANMRRHAPDPKTFRKSRPQRKARHAVIANKIPFGPKTNHPKQQETPNPKMPPSRSFRQPNRADAEVAAAPLN